MISQKSIPIVIFIVAGEYEELFQYFHYSSSYFILIVINIRTFVVIVHIDQFYHVFSLFVYTRDSRNVLLCLYG